MSKVFLSHSSNDKEKYVRKVAQSLVDSIGIDKLFMMK